MFNGPSTATITSYIHILLGSLPSLKPPFFPLSLTKISDFARFCNIFIQLFHMARPSQQLDLALLDAGEEEIRLKGVRGLNVRAICARAGVSPRMLNYYFGSKDNFVHTLLSRGYMNFFRDVEESVRGGETPLDCLRRGLRACLRHTVEGRMALRNIICDAYAGEPAISEMIRDHSSHTRLMFGLVEEAWRRGDLRKDISPAEIFTAVMPGVFLPALQMDPPFPFSLRHIRALIADPKMGCCPHPEKREMCPYALLKSL